MRKYKYVMSGGLAFSEGKDMEKLKALAREGWRLEGFKGLWYRLVKGTPENLDFSVDYCHHSETSSLDKEEYLEIFASAGWHYEITTGQIIHVFSAPEGTEPIYTDKASEIEKYNGIATILKKPATLSSLLFLVMITGHIVARNLGPQPLNVISIIFLISALISVWPMVFTGMPYIAFLFTIRKLRLKA